MHVSAVVCCALTDEGIIYQVRNAEPITASDAEVVDETPVRLSAGELLD